MNRSALLAALALLAAVVDGQPIYKYLDRPVDVTEVIAPLEDYGGELPAALRNPYFFEGRPSFIEGRPSFIEGRPSFIERRPYILEERPLFVQVARPVLVVRRPVQVVVRPIQHTLYHVPQTIVVQEQADDIKRPQGVYYSEVHDSVHPSYTQAEQAEEYQQTLPDSSHVPELIHDDPHHNYSPVVVEEPQETPNQVQTVLHHVPEETETIVKPQETTEFHQQEVVPDGATVEPELPSRVQISDTLTKFPESTEIVVDTTTSPEPLEKVIMVESSPVTPTTDEVTLTNGSADKVDAHQPENIPVVETVDNYELPTSQYAGNHQGGGSVGLGVQGNAGLGFQGNAVFGGGLNGGLGLQGNGGFGGGLNGGLGLQGNGGFGGGLNGGLGLQGNGGFGGGLNGGLGLQGNGGFGGGLNGGLGLQGNGGFGGGLNGGVSGALNKGAGVLGNFGTGANGGALFGGNIGAGISAPGSAGFGGFANIFG